MAFPDLWLITRAQAPVTPVPKMVGSNLSEELKHAWHLPLTDFYDDALPSAFDVAQLQNLRRPAGTSGVNVIVVPFAGEVVAMSFAATGSKTGGIITFFARRIGDSNPLASIDWATGVSSGWARRNLALPFAGDFQAGNELYVEASVVQNQQTLGVAVTLWVVPRL